MENVYINKGQKLDEIWAEIPSNKIIFKNIDVFEKFKFSYIKNYKIVF